MKTSLLFLLGLFLFISCTKDEPANDGLNIPSINNVTDPLNYIKYDVTGDANFSVNTSITKYGIRNLKKMNIFDDSLDANGKEIVLDFAVLAPTFTYNKYWLFASMGLKNFINKTGEFNSCDFYLSISDTSTNNNVFEFKGIVNVNISTNLKRYSNKIPEDISNFVEGTFSGTITDSVHHKTLNFKNGKFRIYKKMNEPS